MRPAIVMIHGSVPVEADRLRKVAAEFGFTAESVAQIRDVASPPESVAAVLFHWDAFGPHSTWLEAIRTIRGYFPDSCAVPAHGFSDPVDWELLAAEGAYHSLWLPLKEPELRQCLGFIWESESRSLSAQSVVGLRRNATSSGGNTHPGRIPRADFLAA